MITYPPDINTFAGAEHSVELVEVGEVVVIVVYDRLFFVAALSE